MSQKTKTPCGRHLAGRSLRDPAANDTSDTATGGIPLQTLPRESTETQRRNGFAQSNSPDRATRIVEDLRNGTYICSICTDSIVPNNTREYNLWHCLDCFNVFHLQCITTWAETDTTHSYEGYRSVHSWRCPCCLKSREGRPEASCWCGKVSLNFQGIDLNNPNACPSICERAKCSHGRLGQACDKPCHPGPCNSACYPDCPGLPRQPNPWHRLCARVMRLPSDNWAMLVGDFILLTISLCLIWLIFSYHSTWWAQPYRYPEFDARWGNTEMFVIVFMAISLFMCLVFSLISFFSSLYVLLSDILNLNSSATKPTRKFLARLFGRTILALLGTGLFILSCVLMICGADILWYWQMRHSCSGYDTRISMDVYDEQSIYWSASHAEPNKISVPTHNFRIWSATGLFPADDDQTHYLAFHLKPVFNSTDPFQEYYRWSGSTLNTAHLAIDVDAQNNAWRMMNLSGTDLVNKWLAQKHNRAGATEFISLPEFKSISETIVKNGTFNNVSPSEQHMYIPELDLQIANMHYFLSTFAQEPFLRIFNTTGKSGPETKAMGDKLWSDKYDPRIVMRTASFGYGRQRLDMCVKNDAGHIGDEEGRGGGGLEHPPTPDDWYVALAIVATMRLRLWENNLRSFSWR